VTTPVWIGQTGTAQALPGFLLDDMIVAFSLQSRTRFPNPK